jgi:hypothetical protein
MTLSGDGSSGLRRSRRTVAVAAVLGVGVAAVVAHDLIDQSRYTEIGTFDGLLERLGPPDEAYLVPANGTEYLVAFKRTTRRLLISSGPAGYAFARNGRRIDFVYDAGEDNGDFYGRWPCRGSGLTLDQARAWFSFPTTNY